MFFKKKTPDLFKLYARNRNTTRFANSKGLAPKLGLVGKQTWPSKEGAPPRRLVVGEDVITVFEAKSLFSAIQYACGKRSSAARQGNFLFKNVDLLNLGKYSKTIGKLPQVQRIDYLHAMSHAIIHNMMNMSNEADEDALVLGSLKYKRTVALYEVPSSVRSAVKAGISHYRIEGVACMAASNNTAPVIILKKDSSYAVLTDPKLQNESLKCKLVPQNGKEVWVSITAPDQTNTRPVDLRVKRFRDALEAFKALIRNVVVNNNNSNIEHVPAIIISPSDGSYNVLLPDGTRTQAPCQFVTCVGTSTASKNIWAAKWKSFEVIRKKNRPPQTVINPQMIRRVTEPPGTGFLKKWIGRALEPRLPVPRQASPRRVPNAPNARSNNGNLTITQIRNFLPNLGHMTNAELRALYNRAKSL